MKETVTVTVRTDSEGVTGRGRGSLSPVLSGFVPIAGGHGTFVWGSRHGPCLARVPHQVMLHDLAEAILA